MEENRFKCSLTTADEPDCNSYAKVTVTDAEGETARGCPKHALAALEGIKGARIDWADSKGLNEWEIKGLQIAEERSRLWAS